jgi:outer membrane protein OmpA-like peptidoglycan-associated protein
MIMRFVVQILPCFLLFVASCAQRGPAYPSYSQTPEVTSGADQAVAAGGMAGSAMDRKAQSDEELEAHVKRDQALIRENKRLVERLRIKGADVRSTHRGVVINLPDMLFEFDRYHLTKTAKITINEISFVLKDVTHRELSIEGHTDSIGKVVYNKQLSLKRAEAVANELKQKGVTGSGMKVRGLGEGYPIATNNSEAGRSRNRRVEIIIENPQ